MMIVHNLGVRDYLKTWQQMQHFTNCRSSATNDELWIVEHPSVFTQGILGDNKHLLDETNIPIIKTDRGGQITYHGLGQVVIYCLIDLKRLGIGVKAMVSIIQNSVIDLLSNYQICAHIKAKAPGVYVSDAKICALGLKVKQGRTYHGLSFNVDMDLSPFTQINPCGYEHLKVTQLRDLTDNDVSVKKIGNELSQYLIKHVTNSRN